MASLTFAPVITPPAISLILDCTQSGTLHPHLSTVHVYPSVADLLLRSVPPHSLAMSRPLAAPGGGTVKDSECSEIQEGSLLEDDMFGQCFARGAVAVVGGGFN
eukprot:6180025-Prymnesium_polylepis.1